MCKQNGILKAENQILTIAQHLHRLILESSFKLIHFENTKVDIYIINVFH